MNLLLVVLSLVFLGMSGFAIGECFRLFNDKSFLEKIALAYGIGTGFIALLMFGLSIVGIVWNYYILVFIIFAASLLFFFRSQEYRVVGLGLKKLDFKKLLLIVIIGSVSFYVVIGSILRPLPSWDGWSSYYLHGKAYYLEGFLSPEVAVYSGVSSPPLVPLIIAFIYFIVGETDDRFSLLLFSSYYLASGLLLFENLRRRVTLTRALFFTLLFIAVPNLIRHAGGVDVGHADIIVGYYLLAAAISLIDYTKRYSYHKLILSQIFLSFGALVKDEGLIFLVAGQALLVYLIIRNKKIKHLHIMSIGFSIIFAWWLFKIVNQLPQNPFIQNFPDFGRLLPVVFGQLKELLNLTRWNLIWPIGIYLIVFSRKTLESKIAIFLILIQMLAYSYIYLTTPINPLEHIAGSFDRLLLHILPLFVFLSAISSANIKK